MNAATPLSRPRLAAFVALLVTTMGIGFAMVPLGRRFPVVPGPIAPPPTAPICLSLSADASLRIPPRVMLQADSIGVGRGMPVRLAQYDASDRPGSMWSLGATWTFAGTDSVDLRGHAPMLRLPVNGGIGRGMANPDETLVVAFLHAPLRPFDVAVRPVPCELAAPAAIPR